MTDKVDEDKVIRTIQKQFRGGEHKLAGLRASEFVYTKGKINQKLADKIIAEIPGIERYISAPEAPITQVPDESGNPLSRQPENRADATGASNVSTDQAVDEQNAVDKALQKGRKNRVKKANADDSVDTGDKAVDENATKLNPDESTNEDADNQ